MISRRVFRRWRTKLVNRFAWIDEPIAWGMFGAGLVSFVSVGVGLIVVGDARLATLLIAADLTASGYSELRDVLTEEPPDERIARDIIEELRKR